MELDISTRYSYSFNPISSNFMTTLATMRQCRLLLFLAIDFYKFCGTLKFSLRSQWENPKICNILKTADRKATRTKIFVTLGPKNCLCRVLFVSDSLSLVWGHWVHLIAEFTMLRFSKGYCSPSFHSVSTKLYIKYGKAGGHRLLLFRGDLPVSVIEDKSPRLIAISHKPILISSSKRSSRRRGPWASL